MNNTTRCFNQYEVLNTFTSNSFLKEELTAFELYPVIYESDFTMPYVNCLKLLILIYAENVLFVIYALYMCSCEF